MKGSYFYSAAPYGNEYPREVMDWVELNLREIEGAFNNAKFVKEYRIPKKLIEGDTRLFDSTISPDGSTGVFVYYDKKWNRLG